MRMWIAAAAAVALAACGPQETACTDIAVASVTLTVNDTAGAPVLDAEVVYSVDGGAAEPCESWDDGSWVCGWEQAGDFEISVSATGFVDAEVTVTVGADECHVIGEAVDVILTAA